MNKFVKIGDYLLPAEKTDNIHSIYDVGRIRRVYFKPIKYGHFIDTSQTMDELLEIFNAKEQPVDWIPCSERLPEDLSEVNVTWINTDPEPYYDFIKGERFTGSAVYYKGKWYWYSSTTKDVLAEYGRYDSEEFGEAIECIAWTPLPKPYEGEQDE